MFEFVCWWFARPVNRCRGEYVHLFRRSLLCLFDCLFVCLFDFLFCFVLFQEEHVDQCFDYVPC